jgi:signal transduction histidine kinase
MPTVLPEHSNEPTAPVSPAKGLETLTDEFVSVVSHELQTPIAIIKGYASTLRRRDANWSPELVEEALEAIEEEADQLSRLVNDLLMVSRIRAMGLSADVIPVHLPSLVDRYVHRLALADPQHRFTTDFPEPFPMVLADHEKIESVLRNLIENAVKYAPAGSEIRVTGHAEGDRVQVAVHDAGPGIPEAERERVFERFYRVDSSNAREAPGTGLGLFICRAIVEAHGGRIWVADDGEPGTTVVFELPISPGAESGVP